MGLAEEKSAFNARAKASMREFLRSKTWEEKVESIERMNEASRIAKEAMRNALARETDDGLAKDHDEHDVQ